MSRTLRRTVIACRVPAAGVAAVLLLVACGGGDGYSAAAPSAASSSAPDSAVATDAAGTTVPSGTVDFCTQAAGLDQRVESALTDRKDDDPSVPDAFHQIAEELRGIDAPAVITSDWDAMAAGLDRMADAFANFDITDSTSLAALDEAERGLTSASKNVENYLRDECGINP